MPVRIVYHVLPAEAGWQVRRGRARRASELCTSKKAAVTAATALAKGHPLSQVVIHAADGTITGDRTYDGSALAKRRKTRARVAKGQKTKARKAAKRRKSARQGVETRRKRAKAQAVKRSTAAKKAASTRRHR